MSDDAGENASGRPDWNSDDQFIADPELLRAYARRCDDRADAVDGVGRFIADNAPIPPNAWEGWLELVLRIDPLVVNKIAMDYEAANQATAIRLNFYAEYLRLTARGLRNTASDYEASDADNSNSIGNAGN